MARVIIQRRVTFDTWLRLDAAAAGTLDLDDRDAARGDWLIPLARWRERRAQWRARPGRTGVWLDPTDDPSALASEAPLLPLIAVRFPAYTDGRGFSIAVTLRREGYRGELRAIGSIGRDQFIELERVGFDSIEVRPDDDAESALKALDLSPGSYRARRQAPVPL